MPKKTFAQNLLYWYQLNKRDLPWRQTNDPYKIWVSEMMLQQTTVATVIKFYKRWIKIFPTVYDLSKVPIEAVLKEWQGLGYYNRARNLHKTAQIIVKEHDGVFPLDPIIIRSMPGFGPYSTGSVLSIAYNLPLTIVDANIRRVIMRILAINAIADSKQDKVIHDFLLKIMPDKLPGDFNQALMELGALICKSKEPLCWQCPLSKFCQAYKQGIQSSIPQTKMKKIQTVEAVIGIIKNGNKYFLQQRPSIGLLADMWEFPGGKIESGEDPEIALSRELNEELGIKLISAQYLFKVSHFYTQYKVVLTVFECRVNNLPLLDKHHKWVLPNNFTKFPMPSGTVKIIKKLIF